MNHRTESIFSILFNIITKFHRYLFRKRKKIVSENISGLGNFSPRGHPRSFGLKLWPALFLPSSFSCWSPKANLGRILRQSLFSNKFRFHLCNRQICWSKRSSRFTKEDSSKFLVFWSYSNSRQDNTLVDRLQIEQGYFEDTEGFIKSYQHNRWLTREIFAVIQSVC